MQVRVLFFGILKDLMGADSDPLTLPEGSTLTHLIQHYEERVPRLKNFAPSLAISVNQEYAASNTKLKSGDEVALLPPVSGGASRCAIVKQKIDRHAAIEQLKRPEDGAQVVFEGIVRNHSRGRRTLYLDYEAYEEMALKQLEDLAEKALAQFQVRDVAVIHRLGRLQIGETSVLIVVTSAHRAAAFDACRWLIDSLKRTVPIWKKEYFEDGAVWADGEPFPVEIPRAGETGALQPASKVNNP